MQYIYQEKIIHIRSTWQHWSRDMRKLGSIRQITSIAYSKRRKQQTKVKSFSAKDLILNPNYSCLWEQSETLGAVINDHLVQGPGFFQWQTEKCVYLQCTRRLLHFIQRCCQYFPQKSPCMWAAFFSSQRCVQDLQRAVFILAHIVYYRPEYYKPSVIS